MRMTTPVGIGMLALLSAAPAAAQGGDPGATARAFIDAVNAHRWDEAAGMVLPATAERYRAQMLSRFVQRTEHLARGERYFVTTACDSVEPGRMAALASTQLFRFAGARTLGEAAALPPRAFMASTLESAFTFPPGAEQVIELTVPRYVGVVVENDSLAHGLYREVGVRGIYTYPVEVLPLRRVDGRWYVVPPETALIRGFLTSVDETRMQ